MSLVHHFLSLNIPKELITLIIAMLPVVDRVAVPIAVTLFKFSFLKSYLLCVLGNVLFVFPIIWTLQKFTDVLMKFKLSKKILENWFKKAQKNKDLIQKYEAFGLAIFVAIPSPLTGTGTASVLAYIFGIKKRYAFIAILVGTCIANFIVLAITYGVIKF